VAVPLPLLELWVALSEELGFPVASVLLSTVSVGFGTMVPRVMVGRGGGGRVSVTKVVGSDVGNGRWESAVVASTGGKLTKSPLAVGRSSEAVINVCVGLMEPFWFSHMK